MTDPISPVVVVIAEDEPDVPEPPSSTGITMVDVDAELPDVSPTADDIAIPSTQEGDAIESLLSLDPPDSESQPGCSQ